MDNKIIILGKAASGKDFLQKQLVLSGFIPLKQYTTRPKRPNENGSEYHFVTEEEFDSISTKLQSIQNFNGWRYGYDMGEALESDVMIFSPGNYIEMLLSADIRMRKLSLCSTVVYLDIDEHIRRERLSKRYKAGNADDSLERRLQADAEDFKFIDNLDWNENDKHIKLCSENEVNDFLKKILS